MSIPPRAPLADPFEGFIIRQGEQVALALQAPPTGEVIAGGAFIARYAVQYLGKPYLAIIPGLIALDYGDMLTGEEAWDFLIHRSNLYPRADVFGYRADGQDDMIQIKWLDLAQPVEVFVFADAEAIIPLAHPRALIAPADAPLPPRLFAYLPRFDTVNEWKTAHE